VWASIISVNNLWNEGKIKYDIKLRQEYTIIQNIIEILGKKLIQKLIYKVYNKFIIKSDFIKDYKGKPRKIIGLKLDTKLIED